MAKLLFYPVLTDNLKEDINFKSEKLTFQFDDDTGRRSIQISEYERHHSDIYIDDVHGIWNSKLHNLLITYQFSMDKPDLLFTENGITQKDSIIGIGMKVSSNVSKLTKVILLDVDIDSSTQNLNITQTINLPKNTFRGKVDMISFLYLKQEGNHTFEKKYAKNKGTILGNMDKWSLYFDGNGSEFSVTTEENPKGPLWRLQLNLLEIFDPFDECVLFFINSKHKLYNTLDSAKKEFNPELLNEIQISIVTMIISKAYTDGLVNELNDNVEQLEEGSFGSVLKYYIDLYEIKDFSIDSIHEQVSKRVRK